MLLFLLCNAMGFMVNITHFFHRYIAASFLSVVLFFFFPAHLLTYLDILCYFSALTINWWCTVPLHSSRNHSLFHITCTSHIFLPLPSCVSPKNSKEKLICKLFPFLTSLFFPPTCACSIIIFPSLLLFPVCSPHTSLRCFRLQYAKFFCLLWGKTNHDLYQCHFLLFRFVAMSCCSFTGYSSVFFFVISHFSFFYSTILEHRCLLQS